MYSVPWETPTPHIAVMYVTRLIDPRDGHPLVVGGEGVQSVHEPRVRGVHVAVGQHQVDVLLVLPLDPRALL